MYYFLLVPRVSESLELMRRLGILDHIFGFTINNCDRVAKLEIVEGLSANTGRTSPADSGIIAQHGSFAAGGIDTYQAGLWTCRKMRICGSIIY